MLVSVTRYRYITVMKIIYSCKQCQITFERRQQAPNLKSTYCSQQCSNIGRTKAKTYNCSCSMCEKSFYRQKRRIISNFVFCSRSCQQQASQKIDGLPTYYAHIHHANQHPSTNKHTSGPKRLTRTRRARVKEKANHTCQQCSYNTFPICQIHHIDRNRDNNSDDNLILLCPNCHMTDHYLAEDGAFRTA